MERNLSSQLNTLPSQSDILSAEDKEIMALGDLLQAILLLIKALGEAMQPVNHSDSPSSQAEPAPNLAKTRKISDFYPTAAAGRLSVGTVMVLLFSIL